MLIYFFRHGEKLQTMSPNPPLSERGNRQAKMLAKLISDGRLAKPQQILSSPKIRAVQSLEPAAADHKVLLRIAPELDERSNSETAEQFYQRIKSHLNWLSLQSQQRLDCLYVVSHSDWIAEALPLIPSEDDLTAEPYQYWAPLQYMGFHLQDGLWGLKEFSVIRPD